MSMTRTLAGAVSAMAIVASAVHAQDKIGIVSCDEFFTKYEACMAKIPQAQQAVFKGQMDQMRAAWKQAAANPQTKASLGDTCTQMSANMKTSMAQFGCQW